MISGVHKRANTRSGAIKTWQKVFKRKTRSRIPNQIRTKTQVDKAYSEKKCKCRQLRVKKIERKRYANNFIKSVVGAVKIKVKSE